MYTFAAEFEMREKKEKRKKERGGKGEK